MKASEKLGIWLSLVIPGIIFVIIFVVSFIAFVYLLKL